MATIRFKNYAEEVSQRIIFGQDVTKDNWKDVVLNKLVGCKDVEYSVDGDVYGYEKFETDDGWCVSFSKNTNSGDWDWCGNPCGEFEFELD